MCNRIFILIAAMALSAGCRKFLNKPPDISQTGPEAIADFQSMLDNNKLFVNSTPGLGVMAADDCQLDTAIWRREEAVPKRVYIWDAATYQQPSISASWANPYAAINVCNVVLDGMDKLTVTDNPSRIAYNAAYGSALFLRAFYYFSLEETYGQPYRNGAAASGVPLRLGTDASEKIGRSPADSVYSQIIKDLSRSLQYLPAGVQPFHNRPGRPAAMALLARVYLCLHEYTHALTWSDSCWKSYHTLLDYNKIKLTSQRPFPDNTNPEILFQCSANDFLAQYYGSIGVDSNLYNSYEAEDLRRILLFQPMSTGVGHFFKGNYTGGFYPFAGLAVDEVLLSRAECYARTGSVAAALNDLDTLRIHRLKVEQFRPLAGTTADSALQLVLQERRKETPFRELRWIDLRRLNPEGNVTITRVLGSLSYTLLPDDLRYTFLIPESEIKYSGIPQNPKP